MQKYFIMRTGFRELVLMLQEARTSKGNKILRNGFHNTDGNFEIQPNTSKNNFYNIYADLKKSTKYEHHIVTSKKVNV